MMVSNLFYVFRARQALVEEKYKRSKAEEGEAKALLQYQLIKAEMERLKKQVENQQKISQTAECSSHDDRYCSNVVVVVKSQKICEIAKFYPQENKST